MHSASQALGECGSKNNGSKPVYTVPESRHASAAQWSLCCAAVGAQKVVLQRISTNLLEDGLPVALEFAISRPPGDGPFPTLVFNHGSVNNGNDPREVSRTVTYVERAAFFNERGWVVVVPQRRGRGKSDGLHAEGWQLERFEASTDHRGVGVKCNHRAGLSWVIGHHLDINTELHTMTLSVGIFLFDNVEVLDFAGPFEVFTTASRVHLRRNPGKAAPFKVFTVAKTKAAIQARAGLKTLPDYSLADCPRIDLLLVPGGVVDEQVRDEEVIAWVRASALTAQLVASVCTGAFVLAKAGLLDQKKATTHWEDLDDLRSQFPEVQVLDGVRWVDEGQVVSSAGIAAGIDMSLHLVARLAGGELAKATARQMDVPYQREP